MYLVQDVATGRLYALKKIRCPFGSEGVQDAMKEAEMYRTFQHENVIKVMVRPFFVGLAKRPLSSHLHLGKRRKDNKL